MNCAKRPGRRVWSAAVAALWVGTLLAPGSAQAQTGGEGPGAILFAQRCAGCHALNGSSTMGPSLKGVYGRRAGVGAYDYSKAMRQSGVTWTDDTLQKFLASPSTFVRGAKMMVTVGNPRDRAAIVAYLRTLK